MKRIFIFALIFSLLPTHAFAAGIGFASTNGLSFSSDHAFTGIAVKVYSVVVNNIYQRLTATVAFFDNGQEIGRASIDVPHEEARQVSTIWTPTFGPHTIVARFVSATVVDSQGVTKQLSAAEIDDVATPVARTVSIDNDSDRDGIGDHEEMATYHTSPMSADSDEDGLSDYQEIFKYKTNPNKADTDGDGLNDGDELRVGRNPLVSDNPPPPPPPPAPVIAPTPAPAPEKKVETPAAVKPKTESAPAATKKTTVTQPAIKQTPVAPTIIPPDTTTSSPALSSTSSVQAPDTTPVPLPPALENTFEQNDATSNWIKVLGIIAALLAVAAGVSGLLAYRERNKYRH